MTGAGEPRLSPASLRTAAVLMLAGTVAFWAGAFTPPYRWWFGVPAREYLRLVAQHQTTWLGIAGAFALGVLLTAAGLVALGASLRRAGDRLWSDLGQAGFLLGSALWLASLAFRASATVSAARLTLASGAVPPWFEPLQSWSGALFALYMVLAYLALAAYGKALLVTGLGPRWLGRAHIIFGVAGAVGFVAQVRVFSPPLLIHLMPGILAVWLLRQRGTRPAHGAPAATDL